MVVLFSVLGVLAYLFGFMVFGTATSSIHEGVALLVILNGTVLIVGAAIVHSIKSNSVKSVENIKPSSDQKIEPSFTKDKDEGLSKENNDIKPEGPSENVENQETPRSSVNLQLISELKGKKLKLGFNSTFNVCEICSQSNTGQLVESHYVCNACKDKYL
ncbi:hypothetical protein QQ214_004619 [Vibrio parahaemolyticus]|nr:hypothetical protein [Vibrio parahaemolyticus]